MTFTIYVDKEGVDMMLDDDTLTFEVLHVPVSFH